MSMFNETCGVWESIDKNTTDTILRLAEDFDTSGANYNAASGWHDALALMNPCGNSGTATYRFFTWRGAAARSYLDGHALSAPSADLGWVADDARNGTYIQYGYVYGQGEPWYDLSFNKNN